MFSAPIDFITAVSLDGTCDLLRRFVRLFSLLSCKAQMYQLLIVLVADSKLETFCS